MSDAHLPPDLRKREGRLEAMDIFQAEVPPTMISGILNVG
jgi:hypothetical protein